MHHARRRAALAGVILSAALAVTACSPAGSPAPFPSVFTPNPGAAPPDFSCPAGQHWRYSPSGWKCVR